MKYYEQLKSKDVFHFFEVISNIPHCSFEEQKISDYLVDFAKERNLEYYQDEKLNVIIKKNATAGYENVPAVILQSHMDMVCEKNAITVHNFQTDPIKHVVKGEMLYADGTTLGADNGVAVAMSLALLDSKDAVHPKLECLFTVQEEVGLLGAQEIDASKLDGKYLINIDSEEEGTFLVSCAGGCRADISIPVSWTILDGEFDICKLTISGLRGGHSGMSIHEERGNSIKLLARLLSEVSKEVNIEIQNLEGGSKDNAIPREATAIVAIDKNTLPQLQAELEKWQAVFNNELLGKDNPLTIQAEIIETEKIAVFNQKTKQDILATLSIVSNGVYSMSHSIHGLVESSKNLGVISTGTDAFNFTFSIRSSVESLLFAQITELEHLVKWLNGKISIRGLYPGWEYNPESKLRDLFIKTYKNMHNVEPKIEAIHAGLECGILKKKLGDVDIISLGPDIFDPHSPDEHVRIDSVDRVYQFIVEVLKKAKEL
ncbi:MAG: aminoacyl-histidine dipeptidase [Peptostreptococcaceae bacterium]|nr:aminoacyl-histidine dipeptidase [Peptostreptococcaceae bacterium]